MERKGQALVEFIIILPIFLLLLLGITDLGKVMYSKIILEDKIGDVVTLIENGKSNDIKKELDKNTTYEIEEDADYQKVILKKKIDILTPGLNLIFGDPYELTITRSILNDK